MAINTERYNDWLNKHPFRKWAVNHNADVRKRNKEVWKESTVKAKVLEEWLKENYGKECVYCHSEAVHIDHRIPLKKGGKHELNNLQLLCKTCNFAKNDMLEEEYLEWIKQLKVSRN